MEIIHFLYPTLFCIFVTLFGWFGPVYGIAEDEINHERPDDISELKSTVNKLWNDSKDLEKRLLEESTDKNRKIHDLENKLSKITKNNNIKIQTLQNRIVYLENKQSECVSVKNCTTGAPDIGENTTNSERLVMFDNENTINARIPTERIEHKRTEFTAYQTIKRHNIRKRKYFHSLNLFFNTFSLICAQTRSIKF